MAHPKFPLIDYTSQPIPVSQLRQKRRSNFSMMIQHPMTPAAVGSPGAVSPRSRGFIIEDPINEASKPFSSPAAMINGLTQPVRTPLVRKSMAVPNFNS